MRKTIVLLLGVMLLVPTIVYGFDLSLVPYTQIKAYSYGTTRPLYAAGVKILGENWPVKNIGLYVSGEWGAISKVGYTENMRCNWWDAAEGCKQYNSWIDEYRNRAEYTSVMIGIQYKIKLLEK